VDELEDCFKPASSAGLFPLLAKLMVGVLSKCLLVSCLSRLTLSWSAASSDVASHAVLRHKAERLITSAPTPSLIGGCSLFLNREFEAISDF